MKGKLYYNLAKDSMRKNKKLYLPYLLTCIGMVTIYYIIVFLQKSETIGSFSGGSEVQIILQFGSWVIALFACGFLFYTNSFLIKRRKKEFGLYSVLGMGRRHLGIVLFWESVIIAVRSIVIGLVSGILLAKLAELALVNMLQMDVDFTLAISVDAIYMTVVVFAIICALIYINSIKQVYFASISNLLSSDKQGEKPPKGNWFFGLLGLVFLCAAYYISATIKNPIQAMIIFFVAVLLVIAGTFLIMISGSVVFCKLLQKRKKYYYKTNHFVSVSSMVYRMKRNGAGLAAICIFATMVLVMISSTSCLYVGNEDTIKNMYLRDFEITYFVEDITDMSDEQYEKNISVTEDIIERLGAKSSDVITRKFCTMTGVWNGNVVESDWDTYGVRELGEIKNFVVANIYPLSYLEDMTGNSYDLEKDEAYLYSTSGTYEYDTISVDGSRELKIKGILKDAEYSATQDMEMLDGVDIFVSDFEYALYELPNLKDANGNTRCSLGMEYSFNVNLDKEEQLEFFGKFEHKLLDYHGEIKFDSIGVVGKEQNRIDFLSSYGGLFFLGILLSLVFIVATVLTIYYKQVSEGYEDQGRFLIMQNLGMKKKEIKKSINSQMLTVFFFPLILAGIHICFAFQIIKKMLLVFSFTNTPLFVTTSIISFIIFAIIYMIVYHFTSKTYYKLVSSSL